MKKIKGIVVLVFLLFLVACSNENPQDVTDLIEKPKEEEALLEGTWEVSEIKNSSSVSSNDSIKIGDKLYIDNELVAYNDDYAFPPKFSAKYVELTYYLQNRGIDITVSNNKNAVVLSASQGQLFSKEFVYLNDEEIFFIVDSNVVILKKISDIVDKKVIDKYSLRAEKERTKTNNGEVVEEDITVLMGVRERIDDQSNPPRYNYYTYCIRIEPNKKVRIEKAENIYFPKKDEFYRFKTSMNLDTEMYNTFWAYPIRLEDEIGNETNANKYSFTDDAIDMRFNYISEDYISFDYSDQSPIGKYAMVKTDELFGNKEVTISDYTGDESSNQVFEDIVYDEISKNLGSVDESEIEYDYTNFGVVRNQGLWVFQTSYQVTKDGNSQQKSFPIDIAMGKDSLNPDNSTINVDQVKNINSQEKDYFELINNQYVAIQSTDEILFYKIKNGLIDSNLSFSIPLSNPTQVIMFEQGLGSYAEKWEKSFTDNNVLIR